MGQTDATDLFKVTETYRAGAEGQAKTEALLRAASSLLEDLLLLKSETPHLVRNIDLQKELASMATSVTYDWIESAARGLRQVESGMRRNLLRSLTLDSFAAQLSSSDR
jgi:DNA polymerase-3 subunit delta'